MAEVLIFVIFFFGIGALCLGAFMMFIVQIFRPRGRNADLWRQEAQTLGLQVSERFGEGLEGRYGGCVLSVHNTSRRDHSLLAGKNARVYITVVEIELERPPTPPIVVETQGLLGTASTLLGGQDIEIGHSRFDRALRVQAADVESARAYLGREGVIDAFGHLHALSHKLALRGDTIKIEAEEVHHGENLRALLDKITHAVSIIDGSVSSRQW